MDAVRPDHDVGRVGRPIGEARHGLSAILAEPRGTVPGTHRARRQLLRDQGEQIGAVNADVSSCAGELMWLVVGGPSVGQPELGRHVPRAQSGDRIADVEPFQHPQPVRRQRHSGPDLGQPRRLLVHAHVESGPRQRNRRCGPAEPAADHDRPQCHAQGPSYRTAGAASPDRPSYRAG
jgi:hypothetical protein